VKAFLIAKRRKPIYAKREYLFKGSFYLAKGKAFEKGENLQTYKCFRKFYSNTFGQMQMNLKRFYPKICKIKPSGVNVVQNFNYVKNTHIHLELSLF
jgi:hypothetical protein